jgi:hypothetical protein
MVMTIPAMYFRLTIKKIERMRAKATQDAVNQMKVSTGAPAAAASPNTTNRKTTNPLAATATSHPNHQRSVSIEDLTLGVTAASRQVSRAEGMYRVRLNAWLGVLNRLEPVLYLKAKLSGRNRYVTGSIQKESANEPA